MGKLKLLIPFLIAAVVVGIPAMRKNTRKIVLWIALGSLITILVISGFTYFTSYEKNLQQMLGTMVVYKHESVMTHLSSNVCAYLRDGDRTLYFGELPSEEYAIEINSPDRATLYVYPFDENTLLIRYEPRNGINRTYKKSGFGDFNRLLRYIYELTDNEVFNESVDYNALNN